MRGRIPNLAAGELDEAQRALYDSLVANEVAWAIRALAAGQSPVFESEDEATRTHSHGGSPTNTALIKTPTQMLLGPSATSVSSIW
jgi:hypothetical protein